MPDLAENHIWGMRTTDDALFLNGGVVAIGWLEMGDLSKSANDSTSNPWNHNVDL